MTEIETINGENDIVIIKISRPLKKNALSLEMLKKIHLLIVDAVDCGARAVVIWGDGQCFSSGADFNSLNGDADDIKYDDLMRDITKAIEESPSIFIAAIDGYCIGAGLDLALSCDFRVATISARFSLPAVKVGILYNPVRLEKIVKSLGHLRRKMLLLGETITAQEAVNTDLVDAIDYENVSSLAKAIEIAKKSIKIPFEAQKVTKNYLNSTNSKDIDYWECIRRELLESDERRELIVKKQGGKIEKTE